MTDLERRGASWLFNADIDVADRKLGCRWIALHIDDAQRSEAVASPVRQNFRGYRSIFIGVGSHETMVSDAERTAFNADEAGVAVTLPIYEAMPHGFTRFNVDIGTQAISDAAAWCVARLSE